GRQAVDRHHDLQAAMLRPLGGNRPDGTGDELRMDVARRKLRQDAVEFPIANERLAADDRDVQRPAHVDEAHEPIYELVATIVREAAERDVAAEMRLAVRITTWAPQGALARDLD